MFFDFWAVSTTVLFFLLAKWCTDLKSKASKGRAKEILKGFITVNVEVHEKLYLPVSKSKTMDDDLYPRFNVPDLSNIL
eukprot:5454299-Lingulodinium_polyedra.AAC.1